MARMSQSLTRLSIKTYNARMMQIIEGVSQSYQEVNVHVCIKKIILATMKTDTEKVVYIYYVRVSTP